MSIAEWPPIDTGGGGGVTDVTATSPIASSGGATPNISLSGIVSNAHGGTGVDSSASTGIAHVAAGTWTFSAVNLSNSDVTGNLAVTHLNSGTSASSSTFWRGDGTWATPAGTGISALAAVGSSPNANAATISGTTLNLEPADGTNPGVVTAGTQTIGGIKTFSGSGTTVTAAAAYTATPQQFGVLGGLPTTAAGDFYGLMVGGTSEGFLDMGNSSSSGRYRFGIGVRTSGTISNAGSAAYGQYIYNTTICGAGSLSAETGCYGLFSTANSISTTGLQVAVRGISYQSKFNYGGAFYAATSSGSGPYNIGVDAKAATDSAVATAVGGFFKIYATNDNTNLRNYLPPQSGGVVVSNGDTPNDIIAFYDDTTLVGNVANGGVWTIGAGTATTHVINTQLATNASDLLTLTNGPTGKAGNPVGYIQINVNGTNRVIPFW